MRATDTCAILQHILKINNVAIVHVLCKVVGIVEMDKTIFMSFSDVFGQQILVGVITASFTRHVITLDGQNGWVLI